jgi:hypothetical protein
MKHQFGPYDPPGCPETLAHIVNSYKLKEQFVNYSDTMNRIISHSAEIVHRFHKGQTRVTGGPYSNHVKDVLGVLFDVYDAQKSPENSYSQFIVPAHVIIAILSHDGVEEEEGLKYLNKRFKSNKKPSTIKTNKQIIASRRKEALDTRISEISDILLDIDPELYDEYAKINVNVRNLVDTLTRYEEQYLFHESMYKILGSLPDREDNLTVLLERSLIKICDRIANQEDYLQRYDAKEADRLQSFLDMHPVLQKRYGKIDMTRQENLSFSKSTHSVWKSIIVLDAIDRGLLFEYADKIDNNGNQYHKNMLNLVIQARERLCKSVIKSAGDIRKEIISNYKISDNFSNRLSGNAYLRHDGNSDNLLVNGKLVLMMQRWQKSDESKLYLKDITENPVKSEQLYKDMLGFQKLALQYLARKDYGSGIPLDIYKILDNPSNILALKRPEIN